MTRKNLKTKIFLDSGDPAETKKALDLIGFLDGQTTNPSLVAKNPSAKEKIASGVKFTTQEVNDFYKGIIQEIEGILGTGKSISVEVAATDQTTAHQIIEQAQEMNTWASHAHVKIPITVEGLKAGEILAAKGMHLNYTLNFSQKQAAAVHAATRGASDEQIYLSPFHGRLDDKGVRGADVINHIQRMLRDANSHVQLLVASVRDYETFLYALYKQVDIITVPYKILEQWKEHDLEVPTEMDKLHPNVAGEPLYEEIDLSCSWQSYDISHELTDAGLEKFSADWAKLIDSTNE